MSQASEAVQYLQGRFASLAKEHISCCTALDQTKGRFSGSVPLPKIKPKPKRAPVEEWDLAKACGYYRAGETYAAIAHRFGLADNTARVRLKGHIKERANRLSEADRWALAESMGVLADYNGGMLPAAIAKKYSLLVARVEYLLFQHPKKTKFPKGRK